MVALKVGDNVKVKAGEETDPSHKGKVGTVTGVSGTTIRVTFADVDGTHQYDSTDLTKE